MPAALPLIICFGDSLTAGFQSPTFANPGPAETPYGAFLQNHLIGRAVVRVSGICGERTDEMLRRFPRDVIKHTPAFTVILGGTNDLGWNIAPEGIMGNLRQLYEQAMAAGIRVVAVTVPSIRGYDDLIARRYELNAMIMQYAVAKGMPCLDLFTATVESGSGRLADQYANDGLHLTTSGYRLMADLLYQRVFTDL